MDGSALAVPTPHPQTDRLLYLHCDAHASHYLKTRLDDLFGVKRFRNEIIWQRFSAKNDPQRFGRIHDTILFYTKSSKFTWIPQRGPIIDENVRKNYTAVEPGTDRRYRLSDLTANKPGGDTSYEWHGVKPYKGRYWAYTPGSCSSCRSTGEQTSGV